MKQYNALQDGYRAVFDHLESLEQSANSKYHYEIAFRDISKYYETLQASSYSPVINAEYRDALITRFENGDISNKKYQRCSRLSYMLDSYYAGEPIALKYSRGKRYKVQLDEHFQTQVVEFESFLTGKMATISIPGYVSIARDFFYFLQEQGMKDFGHLNDTTVIEFIVSCHEYHPASLIGLPIPAEVIEAVNDYIQNARPDVDSDYIFLTINRPYRKLSDKSSVRNILMRQLKNSYIGYSPGTGRGFHVFRRTMGKWLLGASVKPEMISQVLGHRNGEILKRYLPLAPDTMRKCSLGFETVPLRSEVFI